MKNLIVAALAVLGMGVVGTDEASAQFGRGRGGISIGIGTGGYGNGFGSGGYGNGFGNGYGAGYGLGAGYPYSPGFFNNGLYNSGGIGARPGWYSQYAPLGYNPRDLSNNRVNGTNFYPGGLLNNGYVQPSTTYMTPGTTTYVVPSSGTMMQSGGMMISPAMVNPTGHYTVEAMEDGKYVVKGTYPDLAQAAQKQDELKAKNSKMETKIVKK